MRDLELTPIGGYFALELPLRSELHPCAVRLNSGRNSFEYILRTRQHTKVYIPTFTCDAIENTLHGLGISYERYAVNAKLEPEFDLDSLRAHEAFLYTNYFGLKNRYVNTLAGNIKNLIIDNAQSFFSPPATGLDTFYSPRKFFGVPDGGYAYAFSSSSISMPSDHSGTRIAHLMTRYDESAQAGYCQYLDNEAVLAELPMRAMSALSTRILQSIDYGTVAAQRQSNFKQLHNALACTNLFPIEDDNERVALTYPFLTNDLTLKTRLQLQGIYTASYWPNIALSADVSSVEFRYATQIVHLPIDQRYGEKEMSRIVKAVLP